MEFDLQQESVIATVVGVENIPSSILGQKKIFAINGELKAGNIQLPGNVGLTWLEGQLAESVRETLASGAFKLTTAVNPEQPDQAVKVMLDPYLAPHELIVLGGGHIAHQLVQIGRILGYKITVIDDRPDFVLQDCLSESDRSICCSFSDIENVLALGPSSHVVIITRGHMHDLECLRKVIKYPLGYLGMIGSRRKVKMIRDLLLEEGVAAEKIDKVHMPIGLNIGAQTPAEIAVSIAAELIMVRRGGSVDSIGTAGTKPANSGGEMITAVDRETLQKAIIAAQSQTPAALATIVSAKGSTPRKAGARMLIYRDGQTHGTIGGGCAEAEVRLAALTVIDEEKPDICKVSLSADIAALEGMACGGVLEVFIDPVKTFTIDG